VRPTRAQQIEADFRSAMAASGDSESERQRVRELAREAADALLASGEIRRARPVLSSVSTNTAQSVPGPVAAKRRSVGSLRVKRAIGSALSMPITES